MIILITIILSLFLGMLLSTEIGRRIGLTRFKHDNEGSHKGIGAVEGAVFGLLGLLIAFTFSGALERFEDRRHLITEETNDIGTAWLRIDLIPTDTQPKMRELFRFYVDSRLETLRDVENMTSVMAGLKRSADLQAEIWKLAVTACKSPEASIDAGRLLLPALNAMIDITTTRLVALQTHPPTAVYFLLCLISLLSALMAGYGMSGSKSRNFLYMFIFAAVISIMVYVIIDMEFPRKGLIRIEYVDQILKDLRKSMN
jgi:hypothetical protein